MSNFELIHLKDATEVARLAAHSWLDEVAIANRAGKEHYVALSGGRVARLLFEFVAAKARESGISLTTVHFFWADERCVPPDHAESNYRAARDLLFDPMEVPARNIHRIRGEEVAELAARAAEVDIVHAVTARQGSQPVLDWIFLGLGEDGHVASLFPGEPGSLVRSTVVYRPIHNSPKPPPDRISLGYPAIAAARQVWMLATGKDKEAVLRASLSPTGQTPFAQVLRSRPHTKILTDIPVS